MEENITYCAYCGKEVEYNAALFRDSCTGEPFCAECAYEEEKHN